MSTTEVTPAIAVTAGKGTPPIAYYEAVWREPQPTGHARRAKRRIGRAWLDHDGVDDAGRPLWRKRRGRVADGFFDERRAHAAAPAAVEKWRKRQAAREHTPDPRESVTVRQLAHEWLDWLRDVKSASPSTLRDYRSMLAEPGTPHKRGKGVTVGRVMSTFGDRPVAEVTVREISEWLKELDGEGLSPRNVNKHRQVLRSIFGFAGRSDTYALTANPVDPTDKRREAPPGRLDFYEREEVEALARLAAGGAHREPANYKGRPSRISPREAALRTRQDTQDGELFRVMLYSGVRVGEVRALRWSDVSFSSDMKGAVLDVRRAFSANQERPPKSWKPRTVPLPRPAAEALARLHRREHFISDDDFVFVNRVGGRLDDSSVRRRYVAARDAAGLRPVKLHGLRHSAGSIIARGAGVVAARDILGHASTTTTNRYLHGRIDARAIGVMNAAFGISDDASDGAASTSVKVTLAAPS